jgi:hypothetical protein
MNTQHTPGPWSAVQTDRYNTDIQGPKYSVANISIGHDDDVPEMQANARLMAAAPELLAALQRFASAMKQRSYPELQGVACDAFAAIAKATGQESEVAK